MLDGAAKGLSKGTLECTTDGYRSCFDEGLSEGLLEGTTEGLRGGSDDVLSKGLSEGTTEAQERTGQCV